MHIWVGTPPQRVSLIIDTGSFRTAFPCSDCRACGTHTDPTFDLDASSTGQMLTCSTVSDCGGSGAGMRCSGSKCALRQIYGEGSRWSAYLAEDSLWLGGQTITSVAGGEAFATDFRFGCIYDYQGLFLQQKADGIMGLSMKDNTFIATLAAQQVIPTKAFSLCFALNGGTMALGGQASHLHQEPMRYAKLEKGFSGWYKVTLQDIRMGGVSIGVSESVYNQEKGIIVDSGTTDTYLPKAALEGFKSAFRVASGGMEYREVLDLTAQEIDALPDIEFLLQSHKDGEEAVSVVMKSHAYLELWNRSLYTAIIFSERAILGANFMRDHDVHFDWEGMKIGFAAADCAWSPGPGGEVGGSDGDGADDGGTDAHGYEGPGQGEGGEINSPSLALSSATSLSRSPTPRPSPLNHTAKTHPYGPSASPQASIDKIPTSLPVSSLAPTSSSVMVASTTTSTYMGVHPGHHATSSMMSHLVTIAMVLPVGIAAIFAACVVLRRYTLQVPVELAKDSKDNRMSLQKLWFWPSRLHRSRQPHKFSKLAMDDPDLMPDLGSGDPFAPEESDSVASTAIEMTE